MSVARRSRSGRPRGDRFRFIAIDARANKITERHGLRLQCRPAARPRARLPPRTHFRRANALHARGRRRSRHAWERTHQDSHGAQTHAQPIDSEQINTRVANTRRKLLGLRRPRTQRTPRFQTIVITWIMQDEMSTTAPTHILDAARVAALSSAFATALRPVTLRTRP